MTETIPPLLRSVLYMPANNERALAKLPTLDCDAVIFDLEDSVAPDTKPGAREQLRAHFEAGFETHAVKAIRINGIDTPWFTEDLMAARACLPDAIVMPKVSQRAHLQLVEDALSETDAPKSIKLWAMIETAAGVLNVADIARQARSTVDRLEALILGTNDLFKEIALSEQNAREIAHSWLMQIILAAKANGIAAIDGVFNGFRDINGLELECKKGASMGFDGKTLIHPAQITPANLLFAPSEEAVAEAQAIVAAFDQPENADKGVISLGGKMVERLHADQARALLARQVAIKACEMTREEK
ncbi:MAG: CoA ester lyase [Pseudomonadota bacterium]